jgi:hypothetical protein
MNQGSMPLTGRGVMRATFGSSFVRFFCRLGEEIGDPHCANTACPCFCLPRLTVKFAYFHRHGTHNSLIYIEFLLANLPPLISLEIKDLSSHKKSFEMQALISQPFDS